MELLEKTIFKKKNEEIKGLQFLLEQITKKSRFNYNKRIELQQKVDFLEIEKENLSVELDLLKKDKKELENTIRVLNGSKGGFKKEINKLNKIIEEERKTTENNLKIANNTILELNNKIKDLSSDKYLIRKLKPATNNQKQKMGIKSGVLQGKIMNKIKEND